jgi:hypothetical protein
MQHFSTDDVAPSERFSYWKEAVCASFVPLEVECDARGVFRIPVVISLRQRLSGFVI